MKNQKEYTSTQKYIVESPRKLRLVVALIKKLKPTDAVERLPFVVKRASTDLQKVIRSAIANAVSLGESDANLVFKEIQIGEGPRLKRGRAASRGRWHPYKRRMSHIKIVLTTIKSQTPSTKSETKSIDKNLNVENKELVSKRGGKDGKGTRGSRSEK